jgi:hypothetical protein
MERNDVLQNQQKLSNQINKLLEASSDSMLCGPSCQRERQLTELKQKYLDSETNLQKAPLQLEDAREKYLVLKDGESGYNKIRFKELEQKADSITNEIQKKFNEQIKNVDVLNNYLDTELTNSLNTEELLTTYKIKDDKLKAGIGQQVNDVITNDRKSYYENQELDRIKLWNNILNTIYLISLIFLTIEVLFTNAVKVPIKIFIILTFYLYPFIINWIVIFIWNIIKKMYSMIYLFFPKTSYLNI